MIDSGGYKVDSFRRGHICINVALGKRRLKPYDRAICSACRGSDGIDIVYHEDDEDRLKGILGLGTTGLEELKDRVWTLEQELHRLGGNPQAKYFHEDVVHVIELELSEKTERLKEIADMALTSAENEKAAMSAGIRSYPIIAFKAIHRLATEKPKEEDAHA